MNKMKSWILQQKIWAMFSGSGYEEVILPLIFALYYRLTLGNYL